MMKMWVLGPSRGSGILLALVLALAFAGCASESSDGSGGSGGHAGHGTGGTGGDGGTAGTGGDGGTAGTGGDGGTAGTGGTGGDGGTGGTGGTGGAEDRVARLHVSPDRVQVIERQAVQLVVAAFDENDEAVTDIEPRWTSSAEFIATVDGSGLVTAVQPGEAAIFVTVGSRQATALVSVTGAEVVGIAIDAETIDLPLMSSLQLVAHPVDADGNALLGRTLTWTSSDEDVVTVDSNGVATGVDLGTGTVTVTFDEFSATIDVSVVHRFVSITTKELHTCALNAAGAAWCWGYNGEGRLGLGDDSVVNANLPVRVGAGLELAFVSLAAGREFTCGLTAAGDVWCWGSNDRLVLGKGNESLEESYSPVLVEGLAYTAISAMGRSVCGLDVAGLAHCWGYNSDDFELGDPENTDDSADPLAVSAPSEDEEPLSFVELQHGIYYTCGLTDASLLYCWGYNWAGMLGDGTTESRARPAQPLPGEEIVAFGVGHDHACAVKADETTWCWGNNEEGQILANPPEDQWDDVEPVLLPVLRFEPDEFVPVGFALGAHHSCVVDASGELRCWGAGWSGELGRDEFDRHADPAPVASSLSFVTIAAGEMHTCGIATDGKLYCWGFGATGALGTGSFDDTFEPLPVFGQ